MNLHYVEREPPPRLSPWVKCLWQLTGRIPHGQTCSVRGMPGGVAALMYDLGEPALVTMPGMERCREWRAGPIREAVLMTLSGRFDVFGVNFHPGTARPFLGLCLNEVAGGGIEVQGSLALAERLADHDDFSIRYEVVVAALARRAGQVGPPDAAVGAALRRIRSGGWDAPMADLSALTGLGERRLERRFASEVGLSPRTLMKLERFSAAKTLLERDRNTSMAELAHRCGYYDQAHFNRDFKRFAGLSPTAWLAEKAGVGIVQDDT